MEEKLTYKSVDVDELSEKVKRMAVLVEFCKGKLHRTEEDVNNVLKSITE